MPAGRSNQEALLSGDHPARRPVTVIGLPHDRVREILKRHGTLVEH